jgi:outer membrane immunogenic protein
MRNSKMIFGVTVAVSAMLGSAAASAADLPARIYSKAPPMADPGYDWTGFYIGVNAGYAFDGRARDTIAANDPAAQVGINAGFVPTFISNRSDGFTGGGQIGYNYQFRNSSMGGVVIGIEADAAYMDLHRTTDNFLAGFDTQFHSRLDFLGTVRGRFGYGFDRLFIYGTGGFAYGSLNNSMSIADPAGVVGYAGSSQDTIRTGYAYGGGVEYALASNSAFNVFHASGVTVKAEYIHYNLGTYSFLSNGVPGVVATTSAFTNSVRTDGDLVRAGLNYKFGGPVVARY